MLKTTAESQGYGPQLMDARGLRSGGARAPYHACGDLSIVKRRGRRASDACHVYSRGSREKMKRGGRGNGRTSVRPDMAPRDNRKAGAVEDELSDAVEAYLFAGADGFLADTCCTMAWQARA